jgi:hypothetical protein
MKPRVQSSVASRRAAEPGASTAIVPAGRSTPASRAAPEATYTARSGPSAGAAIRAPLRAVAVANTRGDATRTGEVRRDHDVTADTVPVVDGPREHGGHRREPDVRVGTDVHAGAGRHVRRAEVVEEDERADEAGLHGGEHPAHRKTTEVLDVPLEDAHRCALGPLGRLERRILGVPATDVRAGRVQGRAGEACPGDRGVEQHGRDSMTSKGRVDHRVLGDDAVGVDPGVADPRDAATVLADLEGAARVGDGVGDREFHAEA